MKSLLILILFGIATTLLAEEGTKPLAAFQPLQLLIGTWNGGGSPEGTREEKQKGHWSEKLDCSMKFKDKECWITLQFEKGKFYRSGEIRPGKEANTFTLQLITLEEKKWDFSGSLKEKALVFERTDPESKEFQRLTFSLLHDNRITYRLDVRPAGKTFFNKIWTVGATKDGEEFSSLGFSERECVVSGGRGTSTVTYQGKSYYVCCSGCRDEFNANPAKYVAEFEKKRAEAKKK
jgi:hypothetical protein